MYFKSLYIFFTFAKVKLDVSKKASLQVIFEKHILDLSGRIPGKKLSVISQKSRVSHGWEEGFDREVPGMCG